MSGIPYDQTQGFIVLMYTMVLLLLIALLSYLKRIGIGKDFTLAIAKGGAQLFLVAILLTYLFRSQWWYVGIWAFIGGMALIGGYTSAKRAVDMPDSMSVTVPSILGSAGVILSILALTGAMPPRPEFIVPLAGMVFGNSMAICSLTLDRMIREVRLNRDKLEVALALGATADQALETYERLSIRSALIPTVDRLKTLGLIFIPGAMAGLLMAGTDPIVAAEYQLIVYLMIVGGGVISAMLTAVLSRKHMFTPALQLTDWL